MDAAEVLRRAAGVHTRVGQGSTFSCLGRYVCLDCPDDRHLPAFRPFALPHHISAHLQTNPGHRIAWWCWDHLKYEAGRPLVTKGKRGGKRPGAGAPKGNANSLRHGRRSTRQDLRDILALLPADVRLELLPYLRAIAPRMQSIKRRLAWVRAGQKPPANVLPFRPGHPPSRTTTTHDEQSKAPLNALALRATSWGFIGAQAFIYAHGPVAHVLDHIMDDLDAQADAGLPLPRNPGGLLRHSFHLEVSDHDGPVSRCPYCPWTSDSRKEATS